MNEPVNPLYSNVRELLISARQTAVCNVNTLQVLTHFEIGRLIIEHKQNGSERAEYGEQLLKELGCGYFGTTMNFNSNKALLINLDKII
jgi:hypothetical protein